MPFGIGIWESLIVLVIALSIYGWVVCWQKGRTTMFWLGIVGLIIPGLGVLPWVGALRLARPDSDWAQKRYSDEKMTRARARFGDKRSLATA